MAVSDGEELLAEKVYRFAFAAIGAPEHLEIADNISKAVRYRLTLRSSVILRDALDRFPWAFEQNVDLIERPGSPLWLEWPLPTRAGHGGGEKAVTGALLLSHPDVDTVITAVTAWVGEKRIARHSYGVAMVDVGDLSQHAFDARRYYSHDAHESIERIMGQIGLAVPLGFQDEVAIMFDRSEGAMEGILRDSSGEIPFVLAILLAMQAEGGLIQTACDGFTLLDFGQPLRATLIDEVMDKLMRRPRQPLRRKVRGRERHHVSLRWEPTQS